MMIRKAIIEDIDRIVEIYDEIHTEEERGRTTTGWVRGIYPEYKTALNALERGDLFVEIDGGRIVGSGIINKEQVDVYRYGAWQWEAADDEVMVLHTLVISPSVSGHGLGKAFVSFYEEYAAKQGCKYLRMDTNERNHRARDLYRKLGYREAGVFPTVFNGLEDVNLVLLERKIQCD